MLLVGCALLAPRPATAASIDTYVGGGYGDFGPALDAVIDPRGLALTGHATAPEMYVADGRNNRVRRIDAEGEIETVAGNGAAGFAGDGGDAVDAKLNLPLDVARDSAGNLYIADSGNNRIRKVTPGGKISTFAGNGNLSFAGDNGLATAAALNSPYGVAVGPDGYVYIADSGNSRIRRVGPAGCTPATCTITTVAGTGIAGLSGDHGPALLATLRNPADVAFDPSGNLLIADFNNQRVRRVANGIITTIAGGGFTGIPGQVGDGGPAVSAVLRYPAQIAVASDGSVYIADSGQYRVRMVQAGTGIIHTVAGNGSEGVTGDGGPATKATLNSPWGVAVAAPGTLYLSVPTGDAVRSLGNRIRMVVDGTIFPYAGGGYGDGGPAYDALVDPRGADATTGSGLPNLYFADGLNDVVRKVDGAKGTIERVAGSGERGYTGDGGPATAARLNVPHDVAVDRAGNVFVADTSNHVIRRIAPNGVITTVAGTGSRGSGGDGGAATQAQLASPTGIDVDAAGRLFIADSDNYRVRMVANGIMSTVAGTGESAFAGDGGPAGKAKLRSPYDVAVSDGGMLYIADLNDHRIRRVDGAGIITTWAGTGQSGFSGDGGAATGAKLYAPKALSVDAGGRVFVADSRNNRVRMIDAAGVITTVAGNGVKAFAGDGGPATAASFNEASGVAVDPAGQVLFIASDFDDRVRIVDLDAGSTPPTPTRTPTAVPPTPTRTSTPASQSIGIAGSVSYYLGSAGDVPGVSVAVRGPASTTAETNSRGDYGVNVQPGTWTLEPAKLGGFNAAISALDAARVLQAVSGLTSLSAQQRLACDTTGDGTLSTLDAVHILRFSAGVIDRLPAAQTCQSDWLFQPVPATVPGQQLVQPALGGGSCQPGAIRFDPLTTSVTNQNFAAMLFGDCTGNWSSGAAALQRRASGAPRLHLGRPRVRPGGLVRVPVYVQSATPFQALDLRLRFDSAAATFVGARPLGIAAGAMLQQQNAAGRLALSLASGAPLPGSRGAVLMLDFRVAAGADFAPTMSGALVDEQPATIVDR